MGAIAMLVLIIVITCVGSVYFIIQERKENRHREHSQEDVR
jgi:preprotein translocase subunit YajC